jgi:glycine oxidase
MRIIIIGGGIMGLSCAYRLASAGAHVELFDCRRPGQGATLASLGALWPASPLAGGALQELHRESLWGFEEFVRGIETKFGCKIDFRRLGRLTLLSKTESVERAKAQAAAACEKWPRFGEGKPTMEVLEAWEVAREFPELGKQGQCAVRCRATAQVNVTQLVAGLMRACEQLGVRMRHGVRVGGDSGALDFHGGRFRGLKVDGVNAEADMLLVTAGAWSAELHAEIKAVAPVRAVKGQGIRLGISNAAPMRTIIKWESVYLVPWDGQVLVGATTEPEAGFDETPTEAARKMLMQAAVEVIPELAKAELLGHWSGLRPQNSAKGHAPIMGAHPEIPNLYICTGHYKTGIGMAPLMSELVCREIIGGIAVGRLGKFRPGLR